MIEIFKKITLKQIAIIYAICLVNFVILKFFGDIGSVIERVESTIERREAGYWNIGVIPFRSIISGISFYFRYFEWDIASINLLFNIIAFVPMGFLIPSLMRKAPFIKTMGIAFAMIIGIETIQFVTCLGIADIDDVILNMLGCLMGYTVYALTAKITPLRQRG